MSKQVSKHSMTGKPPVVPQHGWAIAEHKRGAYKGRPASATVNAGDFILTHDEGWTSRLIRFGQRLRYRGEEAQFARFNHAAFVVSDDGALVEAVGAGVVRSNISNYAEKDFVLVKVWASDEDRAQAIRYANYCVGYGYGWFTILSLAWTLLTGGRFSFGVDRSLVCSGLVAGAMERTGAIWDRPATHITPADLARYYDVREG